MQDLKPQRAMEPDSSWHFVGAQCDRADPPRSWTELSCFISLRYLWSTLLHNPFFAVLRVPRPATPSHGDGEPRMVEREQKSAQPSLVQALELPPLFSALS